MDPGGGAEPSGHSGPGGFCVPGDEIGTGLGWRSDGMRNGLDGVGKWLAVDRPTWFKQFLHQDC